jgi:hypothetical protein
MSEKPARRPTPPLARQHGTQAMTKKRKHQAQPPLVLSITTMHSVPSTPGVALFLISLESSFSSHPTYIIFSF